MADSHAPITVDHDGGTWVIAISRPEAFNLLNADAATSLENALDAFERDASARVAVITGRGAVFSWGEDTAAADSSGAVPGTRLSPLLSRFDRDKPVIAAVNGDAFDAGFELVLACDLVVAAETAQFALHQSLGGRIAQCGGIARIMRSLPRQQAMSLLLTGRRMSSAEGVLLGFVNEIVPKDSVLETAKTLARQVQQCAPGSVVATKRMSVRALALPSLPDALGADYSDARALLSAAEVAEAKLAFSEKRPPRWAGG